MFPKRASLPVALVVSALIGSSLADAQTRQTPRRSAPPARPTQTRSTPRTQPSPNTSGQSPQTRRPLTNDDVVRMVRSNFNEQTVIAAIGANETNFDVSVDALIRLREANVSQRIIDTMLEAATRRRVASQPSAPAAPQPSLSPSAATTSDENGEGTANNIPPGLLTGREPGIYLRDDAQMTEIFPTTFTGSRGSFLGTALTYGIRRSRIRAVVRGSTANARTTQRRPEFYFYFSSTSDPNRMSGFTSFGATSPGEFVLVKMQRKSNSREAVVGEVSVYSTSTGARSRDIRDFTFERVRPGIFRVVLREDLDAGEYCFFFAGTPTGLGFAGGRVFNFSVAAP